MNDRELEKLARYMLHIALVDDFRSLQHKVDTILICDDAVPDLRLHRTGRISRELSFRTELICS